MLTPKVGKLEWFVALNALSLSEGWNDWIVAPICPTFWFTLRALYCLQRASIGSTYILFTKNRYLGGCPDTTWTVLEERKEEVWRISTVHTHFKEFT